MYCLSSEEALKNFLLNPRPYLLPPMPRPPLKIFIFGPPSSGKTTLSYLLAKHYNRQVSILLLKVVLSTFTYWSKLIGYGDLCVLCLVFLIWHCQLSYCSTRNGLESIFIGVHCIFSSIPCLPTTPDFIIICACCATPEFWFHSSTLSCIIFLLDDYHSWYTWCLSVTVFVTWVSTEITLQSPGLLVYWLFPHLPPPVILFSTFSKWREIVLSWV